MCYVQVKKHRFNLNSYKIEVGGYRDFIPLTFYI